MNSEFDVIIIGCGHAGAEAVLASARTGANTAVFCLDFTKAASMPCNPSIGGSAKGQIVGEIDALGGVMGEAADNTYLQIKRLNRSRGPAVHALRTQNDKYEYPKYVQNKIKSSPNITIIEQEAVQIITKNNSAVGIITNTNKTYLAKSIVITTGTYLKGRTHIGLNNKAEGRMGEAPSNSLSDSIKSLGIRMGRLKTGTTPRLCSTSLDYSKMTVQPGDNEPLHFSFRSRENDRHKQQVDCYLTNTNKTTQEIVTSNLDRSPMYQGIITGSGPRYCPSLEDKMVRFADKPSHHLFIEPESTSTTEIYVQGFNTSLPEDVQRKILDSIDGLKGSIMLKPGYAVEYDFVYPDQLYPTLESKDIQNLFFAGQINGTSGYEEAAGQGLIAGLNASKKSRGQTPIIVSRETSYIGTMIDDLTSKNVIEEPYRMMTSRSEYRLLLRQDNAIFRLSELAYEHQLLNDDDISIIRSLKANLDDCIHFMNKQSISSDLSSTYKVQKMRYASLIKRPEINLDDIHSELIAKFDAQTIDRAIIEVRYSGYIKRQQQDIDRLNRFNDIKLSSAINYDQISGLRTESRQKLSDLKPKTIFEAKKIAGINPADIMILLSHVRS